LQRNAEEWHLCVSIYETRNRDHGFAEENRENRTLFGIIGTVTALQSCPVCLICDKTQRGTDYFYPGTRECLLVNSLLTSDLDAGSETCPSQI